MIPCRCRRLGLSDSDSPHVGPVKYRFSCDFNTDRHDDEPLPALNPWKRHHEDIHQLFEIIWDMAGKSVEVAVVREGSYKNMKIEVKDITSADEFYKDKCCLLPAQHINDLANQNPPLAFGRFQCYSSNPASNS
ncbi:hypothetical protein P8452_41056 [Trifolium repens]|nr:hypothetical protein P8452_41056 [Trifolium repens]